MLDPSIPVTSHTFSGLSAEQTVRWDEWQRVNSLSAGRTALHCRIVAAVVMLGLLGTLIMQLSSPVVG